MQGSWLKNLVILMVLGTITVACAEDGPAPLSDTVNGKELPTTDAVSEDSGAPVDTNADDTQTPPVDSHIPDTTPQDTSAPDLTPDDTPPTIVATTPQADTSSVAVPFTVSVTFSEAIASNTIAEQTFKVLDIADSPLAGSYTMNEDNTTVTWTPNVEAIFQPVSPYKVWLAGGIISDLAGNKLVENYTFHLTTEGYPNTENYAALAATHAPRIHVAMDETLGDYFARIPVAVNADGNWDVSDNITWIKSATSLTPTVYYDVVETQSHTFIHYMFVFPWVHHSNPSYNHGNGVSGSMVILKKATIDAPANPLGVTTYLKKGQYEENLAYVTDESGIKGPQSANYYRLMGAYSQKALFPNGQYDALITAGKYESCLYIDTNQTGTCEFSVSDQLVFVYANGVPTIIAPKDGKWPKNMSDFAGEPDGLGYALLPLTTELWARRNQVGPKAIWGGTASYTYNKDGDDFTFDVPNRFVDPADDINTSFGRPVWAWRFNPTQGALANVDPGQIGIDPAGYYLTMHGAKDKDTALVPFVPETGEGFSTTYCFNPYLNIDRRNESDCQP
jgi:hypothetical protein